MLNTIQWIIFFHSISIRIGMTTWVYPNKTERLPVANMAMAVGSFNHTIFLLGGNPSPRQMTKYQTKSKNFVYGGDNALPINTSAMGQGWTQQGNILYLVDIDFPINLAMYHMNTQQFTTNWTNLPIEIGPHSCLASSKDTLFVVGGRYNLTAYHNKLQILNLTTLQWTNNPPSMNDVRTQAACIVANDYLWAFGGRYDPVDFRTGQLASNERVELNNITQNTWVYVDSLTTALTGLRAVVYKDTIYVIGGNAFVYTNDIVHLMDTQTGALTGTDHLPFLTAVSSPIVVRDVLYVFGGHDLFVFDKWTYFNFSSPTTNPSTAPTGIPSVSPSSPSVVPSVFPSIPSIAPSKLPTSGPSKSPTSGPSDIPTSGPSKSPTSGPSNVPTSGPSNVPSIHPTAGPSQWSSSNPSQNPSVQPSGSPIETTVALLFNETHAKNIPSVKDTQIQTTYIVSIAAVAVFLCIVLCVLVYKKQKSANVNETLAAKESTGQILMTSLDTQLQSSIAPNVDRPDGDDGDETEKDVIKTWLIDIVKLPQYYSLFVDNGYNTLRIVAAMTDKSELREIGITLQGHQTRIIREINRLNEKTIGKKGEESLSEDVDDEQEIISGPNTLMDGGVLHRHDAEYDDEVVLSGINTLAGNVDEVIAGGNTLGEGDGMDPSPPPNGGSNVMRFMHSAEDDTIIKTDIGGTIK
eukprot:1164812_1